MLSFENINRFEMVTRDFHNFYPLFSKEFYTFLVGVIESENICVSVEKYYILFLEYSYIHSSTQVYICGRKAVDQVTFCTFSGIDY